MSEYNAFTKVRQALCHIDLEDIVADLNMRSSALRAIGASERIVTAVRYLSVEQAKMINAFTEAEIQNELEQMLFVHLEKHDSISAHRGSFRVELDKRKRLFHTARWKITFIKAL